MTNEPISETIMTNEPTSEALRTEYKELASHLRMGISVLWDAFRTYFTISALLFGGAGVLLSDKSPFAKLVSLRAVLAISVAAIIITVVGFCAIRRTVRYQQVFLERGCRIDARLGTELMRKSKGEWDKATSVNAEYLTYAVFLVFVGGWLLLGFICLTTMLATPHP